MRNDALKKLLAGNANFYHNAPKYKEKILILARTKMKDDKLCIGACILANNQYVRLLDTDEQNLKGIVPYNIGEVYEIEFCKRNEITPPHIEDVVVLNSSYLGLMDRNDFFARLNQLNLNLGCVRNLFDGCLNWDGYNGYLLKNNIHNGSVCITSLNYHLTRFDNDPKHFKVKLDNHWYSIPYVGDRNIDGVKYLPKGTLIRFSLARWWAGHGRLDRFGNPEFRSYLQISGFYR